MKVRYHWAIAALFVGAFGTASLSHAAAVSGQGTWETTLQGRDLDSNLATTEAWYDTALNITWLVDANHAMTTGYDADGLMDWTTANSWATGLNPYSSGITGWRLPTTVDENNDGHTYTNINQGGDTGYNIIIHSEMSHMYYVTLGDKAYYSTTGTAAQPGWGLTNTGPFSNVQSHVYWSATEVAPNTSKAWSFVFLNGFQYTQSKTNDFYAWAIHSGDVGASTVPVPATLWLFGSGLIGLLGMSRKRRR